MRAKETRSEDEALSVSKIQHIIDLISSCTLNQKCTRIICTFNSLHRFFEDRPALAFLSKIGENTEKLFEYDRRIEQIIRSEFTEFEGILLRPFKDRANRDTSEFPYESLWYKLRRISKMNVNFVKCLLF